MGAIRLASTPPAGQHPYDDAQCKESQFHRQPIGGAAVIENGHHADSTKDKHQWNHRQTVEPGTQQSLYPGSVMMMVVMVVMVVMSTRFAMSFLVCHSWLYTS